MTYRQTIKAGVYAVDGETVTLEAVDTPTAGSRFIGLTVTPEEAATYAAQIGEIIEIEAI